MQAPAMTFFHKQTDKVSIWPYVREYQHLLQNEAKIEQMRVVTSGSRILIEDREIFA